MGARRECMCSLLSFMSYRWPRTFQGLRLLQDFDGSEFSKFGGILGAARCRASPRIIVALMGDASLRGGLKVFPSQRSACTIPCLSLRT